MVRLGAGPMSFVDGRVADDPLVVDRVVVDEHEGDRHAVRHGHRAGLVVRVVDRRSRPVAAPGPAARAQAAAIPAARATGRSPPTRASAPGRRTARFAVLRPRPAGPDRRMPPHEQQDPAMPTMLNSERRAPPGAGSRPRPGSGPTGGRARPRRSDGCPAPLASIARSKRRLRRGGVDPDLRQPGRSAAPSSMPLSERRSVEQRGRGRRAVRRASGRRRRSATGRRAGRRSVSR